MTGDMFDDIRPYRDAEIKPAMCRIAEHKAFPTLASFVFPESSQEEVGALLRSIDGTCDFQKKVMYQVNRRIIQDSITEFTYGGVTDIERNRNYVYLSNHRDIMLDASLLQNVLVDNGLDTTEITFGANLMQDELVVDIGKANKMFRVERPGGNIRAFYRASKHLSDYIHHEVVERGQSVWIAQCNGRTKDGVDRTDQGVINMFRLGGPEDKVKSIAELNLLPVAVSYEWEPCDILKTFELYARRRGPYVKKEGEDLVSILTGIRQPKGRVHFQICPPITEAELVAYAAIPSGDFNKQVARLVDRRICTRYRLWANNFIAHDLLTETSAYSEHYSREQKDAFLARLTHLEEGASACDLNELRTIFLGIYAHPVDSAHIFKDR